MQRAERIQFAPDRPDFVENRIAILYNLQKKHHVVSIEELIAVHNNFIERLENITSGDDNIKEAEKIKENCFFYQNYLIFPKKKRVLKPYQAQFRAFPRIAPLPPAR